MKNFIFPVLISLSATCLSQSKIYEYGYDDSGNRTSRTVVYLRTAQGGGNSAEAPVAQQTILENPDGLTDELVATSISLFPNPTSSKVHIRFSDAETLTEEVRVLDGQGKVVYRKENAVGDFSLPFENLAPGAYFIWLKLNGKVERYQVIKE